MNTTMKLFISILAALVVATACTKPGGSASPTVPRGNADGFGGGGKALGKLEASRLIAVTALKKIQSGIDLQSLCAAEPLDTAQRALCRNIIVDNVDALLARHIPPTPLTFEIKKAPLDNGLIAMTAYAAEGPVYWDEDKVVSDQMPVEELVVYIVHETLHKIEMDTALFPAGFPRDTDTPGPFTSAGGARVLLDSAGKAIRRYILDHTGYSDYVKALAPLAYWRFGETQGTVAVDASGNHHDAVYNDHVQLGAAGAIRNDGDVAAKFNPEFTPLAKRGTVTATVPEIPTDLGTSITVSFWIKWDGETGADKNLQTLYSFGSYDLFFVGTQLGFNTGHSDIFGAPVDGLAGNWGFISAVMFNGDPHQNKLYLNGEILNAGSGFLLTDLGAPIPTTPQSLAGPLVVGSWFSGTGYGFHGAMDEFSIHKGELNPAQINALYRLGVGTF